MVTQLPSTIKISYDLNGLTSLFETDIKDLVVRNINEKRDSYLSKFFSNDSSELLLDVRMKKNSQNKYEGSFEFILDGSKFLYTTNVPFKEPVDVVNHAFKHLKEHLSASK